jgi:hypothetical protein
MDHFKKYLSARRDHLSDEEPDEAIWQAISRRVQTKSESRVVYLIVKRLAAACVLLLAATGLYFLLSNHHEQPVAGIVNAPRAARSALLKHSQPAFRNDNDRQLITKNETSSKTISISDSKNKRNKPKTSKFLPSALRNPEMELHYINDVTSLIESQKTIISSTPVTGATADYFNILVNQYRSLEAEQKNLEDSINTSPTRSSALLEKMIINLKKRVKVLESLKREIDKVNETGKNKPGAEKIYIDII